MDTSIRDYVGVVISRENVTTQMVDDILCSAFEGGINYWAVNAYPQFGIFPEGAEYTSQVLTRGSNIIIEEYIDNDEIFGHLLTVPKFLFGLEKAIALRGMNLESFYEYHDAGDADIVVQFALFEDVIYG